MKKRLLTVALAMVAALGAFAYGGDNAWRSGNFYYTENAKWELVGSGNLIADNDLSAFTTTATDDGGQIDKSAIQGFFTSVPGAAPSGADAFEVTLNGAENTGGDIYLSTAISAGNYIVTYKVKGATDRIMSNPSTLGTNSQRVFLNSEGSVDMNPDATAGNAGVPLSKQLRYGTEWKEFAYVVTVSEDMYAVFRLTNVQVGDQFADFAIYEVKPAFDEREITSYTSRLKEYLQDKVNFPNDKDGLTANMVTEVESVIAQNVLTPETKESTLDYVKQQYTSFMDQNTVEISKYFKNFDLGPELTKNASKTVVSGWTLTGDGNRWNRKSPAGEFTTTHINQEAGAKATPLGEDSYYQEIKMIPGSKVLYTVLSKGNYLWKGTEWGATASGSYNVNFADTIPNQRFFINNDTTVMEHLSASKAKEFTMIGTVGTDSILRIGFRSSGASKDNGGDFRFDNVEIRLIGGATQAQVDEFYWKNNILLQRSVLAEREATVRNDYLNSDKYIYAKDSLQAALDSAAIVDAMPDAWTQECHDAILKEVNRLKQAWLYVEAQNKEYTDLAASIEKADIALADESRPKGKNELKNVNDPAKNVYAGVQAVIPFDPENADVIAAKENMAGQKALLDVAVEDFYYLNAKLETPGDVLYVNPDVTTAEGWTRTRTDNTSFGSQGYSYSRGNSANDAQRVYQDVTVKQPGLYIFTAVCAANNNGSRDSEDTGVYIYMGSGENTDSTLVHTKPIKEDWNPGEFGTFEVRHIVKDVTEENPVQIGLNADYNKCANQIRFGFTTLKYYGDYSKYVEDSIKMVMKPTKDSLQNVINALTELKNEARNPKNVDTTPLTQALSTAQNVVDNSEDFDLILSQFTLLETARQNFVLSGVQPAVGKWYDLSFVVKNPSFAVNEDDQLIDWTSLLAENQYFNIDEGLLYAKNLTGVEEQIDEATTVNRTKVSQQLANLPEGAFAFGFNATYHNTKNNDLFVATGNVDCVNIFTPTDTVAAQGVVADGIKIDGPNAEYGTDQNNTYLVYSDDAKLLLYDYRHGASTGMRKAMKAAFGLGYYLTMAKLDVAANETPEVGFYLQNLPTGDRNFFLANPTLYFFGDDANREEIYTGIATVENKVAANAAVVYNLAGQKLGGKAQKGIYIQNGKKVVIK